MFKKIKNKGLSLTETMVVIGIIGVIGTSIFATYQYYKSKVNVDRDVTLHTNLKDIINNNAMFSNSYNGITIQKLIKEGGFPTYSINNSNLQNINGSSLSMNVKNGNWANSDNDLITVKSDGYGRKECTKIVSNTAEDFFVVSVNNQIIQLNNDGSVNISDVSSKCNKDDNIIAFNMVKQINLGALRQSQTSVEAPDEAGENIDPSEPHDIEVLLVNLPFGGTYPQDVREATMVFSNTTFDEAWRRYCMTEPYAGDDWDGVTIEGDGPMPEKQYTMVQGEQFKFQGSFPHTSKEGKTYPYMCRDKESALFTTIHFPEYPYGSNSGTGSDDEENEHKIVTSEYYKQQKIRMKEAMAVREACVMPDNTGNLANCNKSLFF